MVELKRISFLFFLLLSSITLGSLLVIENNLKSVSNEDLNMFKESTVDGLNHIQHHPIDNLNSIDAYVQHIRKFLLQDNSPDAIARTINDVVSEQYIHEPLKYKCSYNWFGCLLSKTTIPKVNQSLYVLRPNHIVKAKNGFCSQKALLIQNLLNYMGHDYLSLTLSWNDKDFNRQGHYLTLAFIKGKEFIIDTNLSPRISYKRNESTKLLSSATSVTTFYNMYSDILELPASQEDLDLHVNLNSYNSYPASNGLTFQKITEHISWLGWIYPFVLFTVLFFHGKLVK